MPCARLAVLSSFALILGFGSQARAAPPPADPVALPDYQTPVVQELEPRPLDVPHDGMGAFGVAGVSLGFAALGFAGSADLIARDDSSVFWGLALGAAIPLTIMGGVALGVGVRNRWRYQAWAAETGIEAKRQGNGMAGTAAMLLIGGSGAVTIGALSSSFHAGIEFSTPRPTPFDPLAIGIGVGSVLVGSGLLIAGSARAGRFKRWRAEQQLQMLPSVAPTSKGLSLGVVGRF